MSGVGKYCRAVGFAHIWKFRPFFHCVMFLPAGGAASTRALTMFGFSGFPAHFGGSSGNRCGGSGVRCSVAVALMATCLNHVCVFTNRSGVVIRAVVVVTFRGDLFLLFRLYGCCVSEIVFPWCAAPKQVDGFVYRRFRMRIRISNSSSSNARRSGVGAILLS